MELFFTCANMVSRSKSESLINTKFGRVGSSIASPSQTEREENVSLEDVNDVLLFNSIGIEICCVKLFRKRCHLVHQLHHQRRRSTKINEYKLRTENVR